MSTLISSADLDKRLEALLHRFRQQERFARGYSPLYAAVFGTIATWLAQDPPDPIAGWLVEAAEDQPPFNVTNLLAAALHRDVLMAVNDVADLAAYYPSVGGDAALGKLFDIQTTGTVPSSHFISALRAAINARQDAIQKFIQVKNVQTNETGRGIIWLLPVCAGSLTNIHLLDLGASAGLNLAAERRAFRFVDQESGKENFRLGLSLDDQFVVHTQCSEQRIFLDDPRLPHIKSRVGCDIKPFRLHTAVDELTLASFVWADQLQRLHRLREGITAFQEVNEGSSPAVLHQVALPDDLLEFLNNKIPNNTEPLIIYNTYIKMYLANKGAGLREVLAEWAAKQNRPIIWLQWEPAKYIAMETRADPVYGWLAWTADCWQGNAHRQWQLGWVHPHGHLVSWLPGMHAWIEYWQEIGNQKIIL